MVAPSLHRLLRERLLEATLMLVLSAILAACGDSASPSSGGAATPAATAATQAAATATTKATATAPADAPVEPPPNPTTEPRVNFQIDDAEAEDLLQALSHILDKTVKIDPAAQPYMPCAKATIKSPDPITPSEALARTTLALRPAGLAIRTTETEILVTKAPDAPSPCPKH